MGFSTAIIVFPGTNRERDMAAALIAAGAEAPMLVWHRETVLPKADLIVLPGGFSYGDYLRSGAMAAVSPIMRAVIDAGHSGAAILGVCNGFQMLCETGLLPGALIRNRGLRFVCKWVDLIAATSEGPFMQRMDANRTLRVPVAHHDGNFVADPDVLAALEAEDRIAFRYCGPDGSLSDDSNFNGSSGAIAGIMSANRRVLGMMPHPENATLPHHRNRDGLPFFRSLIEGLA